LYSVDTGYACGGIVVEDGVVKEAAPIFKWMIGKTFGEVKAWKKIKTLVFVCYLD
jgi:hypothetical protein